MYRLSYLENVSLFPRSVPTCISRIIQGINSDYFTAQYADLYNEDAVCLLWCRNYTFKGHCINFMSKSYPSSLFRAHFVTSNQLKKLYCTCFLLGEILQDWHTLIKSRTQSDVVWTVMRTNVPDATPPLLQTGWRIQHQQWNLVHDCAADLGSEVGIVISELATLGFLHSYFRQINSIAESFMTGKDWLCSACYRIRRTITVFTKSSLSPVIPTQVSYFKAMMAQSGSRGIVLPFI